MTMAKLLAAGLAAIVTYLLSFVLYLLATLAYAVGAAPSGYGGVLEVLTGLLAAGLVSRERPGVRGSWC